MTDESTREGHTRLSFIRAGAGAAVGAVAVGVPVAVVVSEQPAAARTRVDPSSAPPREPVMAYVRDAERGEVTVVAGTSEMTYRDPVLVRHLLDAAPRSAGETGVA